MGKTGELVRCVFSKNRSGQRHDIHAIRSNGSWGRKRWGSSVRSYLCGDQLNSSLQMEGSASVRSSMVGEVDLNSFRGTNVISSAGSSGSMRSSEATVNQPLFVNEDNCSKDIKNRKGNPNSTFKLFQQEDAAVIIQSAFRSFRARRASIGGKLEDDDELTAGSPPKESIDTSVEVQTGNSSIREESIHLQPPIRHRPKTLKLQENWDDSTVSTVISKMRIQHKLEAATRRERALAYAFSQQLRICSKKTQNMIKNNKTNAGWSWLERWMAARQPESYAISIEDRTAANKNTVVRKRLLLDSSVEEKESCGSNDVSLQADINGIFSFPRNIPRPSKLRCKATRNFSRQKSTSTGQWPSQSMDVKRVCLKEDGKEKRKRSKLPPGHKRNIKHKDATAQRF